MFILNIGTDILVETSKIKIYYVDFVSKQPGKILYTFYLDLFQ